VGPRAGLDAVVSREVLSLYREREMHLDTLILVINSAICIFKMCVSDPLKFQAYRLKSCNFTATNVSAGTKIV
jgi:hypothetical protein